MSTSAIGVPSPFSPETALRDDFGVAALVVVFGDALGRFAEDRGRGAIEAGSMVNREIRSRPSSWGRYTRERCPLSGPECRMPQGKPRSIPNSGLYTYLLQPHGATTRLLNSNSIHARRTTELAMGSLADRPTPV